MTPSRATAQARPAPEPAPLVDRGPRLLLAEDDDAFRELLREALEAAGFEVDAVASGRALEARLEEAVVLPDGPRYDLVVSDVRMPGASGLDVLERHYPRDPDTPFLLVTAFGDRVTHARAAEFDVAVIDKPFDVDELVARCWALVDGWGAGR